MASAASLKAHLQLVTEIGAVAISAIVLAIA
jgi:hypothetical protein